MVRPCLLNNAPTLLSPKQNPNPKAAKLMNQDLSPENSSVVTRSARSNDEQTSSISTKAGPWSTPTNPDVNQIAQQIKEDKAQIRFLEQRVKDRLAKFTVLYDEGQLEDDGEPGRFAFDGITFNRKERTTFIYSDEVKRLQEIEKDTGIATAKVTAFWTTVLK